MRSLQKGLVSSCVRTSMAGLMYNIRLLTTIHKVCVRPRHERVCTYLAGIPMPLDIQPTRKLVDGPRNDGRLRVHGSFILRIRCSRRVLASVALTCFLYPRVEKRSSVLAILETMVVKAIDEGW